jgi:Domain of unknown function (DUF5063)
MPAPGLQSFVELAAGFCSWCEMQNPDFGRELQATQWLARLHAAAVELPKTESSNHAGLPKLPAVQLAAAQRNFEKYAGWYYRTVSNSDPTNTDEPGMGDVGDDLMDTYKDIKAGSLLYHQGLVAEALWYWSYLHRVHWGQHVLGALSALHSNQAERER